MQMANNDKKKQTKLFYATLWKESFSTYKSQLTRQKTSKSFRIWRWSQIGHNWTSRFFDSPFWQFSNSLGWPNQNQIHWRQKAGQATHSLTTSRKIFWICWWQSFHFWAAVFVFSYFIAWTGKCEATQKQTTLEWRLTVTSSSTTSSVGVLRRATDVRTLSRALSISVLFFLSLFLRLTDKHTHTLSHTTNAQKSDGQSRPTPKETIKWK